MKFLKAQEVVEQKILKILRRLGIDIEGGPGYYKAFDDEDDQSKWKHTKKGLEK